MTIQEMNERKKEFGYSYEKIAELSGVPVSTVRKVLGGITKAPRYATLQALAAVLTEASEKESETWKKALYGTCEAPVPAVGEASPSYRMKRQGEYTLEDYLALPDERRVELIDGVFYDMSAPRGTHQLIAGELHAEIRGYIRSRKGTCLPFIAPVDVQLDCDERTIVQPDVLILCDTSKFTPERIVGAPDFVAEVLSPATRTKDMVIKLEKYRHAGVREFWLVDPDKKVVITYQFGENTEYAIWSFRDRIPVGIYNGDLVIDFAKIDDYVTPWM